MSALVFPSLPGLDIALSRAPAYKVTTVEALSGREDRTVWSSTPRFTWSLRFNFLRSSVNCTGAGWTTYSELAAVQYMIDQHYASWDSFHIVDPWDGTTDRVVRFVENSVKFTRIVTGVWSCEFDVISVI
jgi:3'-phosphoadenosine 5'-phosphosulfate (PAPS) 3'-phosphatase